MKARKGESLSYRDFPPTDEDEKTRSWNMPGLNIDMEKEDIPDATIKINIDTEEMYESRTYNAYARPLVIMKILSKRNKKTGIISIRIKLTKKNGDILSITEPKEATEKEYRDIVRRLEEEMADAFDIKHAIICDYEYYKRLFQQSIKQYKDAKKETHK